MSFYSDSYKCRIHKIRLQIKILRQKYKWEDKKTTYKLDLLSTPKKHIIGSINNNIQRCGCKFHFETFNISGYQSAMDSSHQPGDFQQNQKELEDK